MDALMDRAEDVRAYGLSKDPGGIARQFVLGVIQTAEGLPIAHQVLAGNGGEVTTLIPMIEVILRRYALQRGPLSLNNLAAIGSCRPRPGHRWSSFLPCPSGAIASSQIGWR